MFYKHNNDVYLTYSELCMKINYLAIILVFGWSWLAEGMSFDRLTILDRERELARVQICDNNLNSNNLVTIEQILNSLWGFNYTDLISMALPVKNELIDQFKVRFCKSMNYTRRLRWSEYTAFISDFNNYTQQLKSALLTGEPNLVALEYLLKLPYESLIGLELYVKWHSMVSDLNNYRSADLPDIDTGMHEVLVVGAKHNDLDGFNPTNWALASIRGMSATPGFYTERFFATVGKPWEDSVLGGPLNFVKKREYPDLNKYNQGANATDQIILENNYALFFNYVPENVRACIADINGHIGFYVKISSGFRFYDKGRRYNLIFHGAMADWYDDEMRRIGFNFETGAFERDLPMGVFNFNGIEAEGGDIAKNRLAPLNVNAHNDLYSPDNAGFIITTDRHVVTFWSVAKSVDKQRAVITFHILFDQDLPNDFNPRFIQKVVDKYAGYAGEIPGYAPKVRGCMTLDELLKHLDDLSQYLSGADKLAWEDAIVFLCKMYGHNIILD